MANEGMRNAVDYSKGCMNPAPVFSLYTKISLSILQVRKIDWEKTTNTTTAAAKKTEKAIWRCAACPEDRARSIHSERAKRPLSLFQSDILLLKHDGSIFRQSSNPVCGSWQSQASSRFGQTAEPYLFYHAIMLLPCFRKRMSASKSSSLEVFPPAENERTNARFVAFGRGIRD